MNERLYGLFERERGGRVWVRRFPALAFPKSIAVRLFQDHLLFGTMAGKEMALRPVNGKEVIESC